MASSLRFTKKEETDLQNKCIELNKALIKANKMPIRPSELAHQILEATIKHTKLDKDGKIKIHTSEN